MPNLKAHCAISKQRTGFDFAELIIDKIDGKDVYPGKEVKSKKWWPDDKMKLAFTIDYIG